MGQGLAWHSGGMRVRVLGPLKVEADGQMAAIPGAQRAHSLDRCGLWMPSRRFPVPWEGDRNAACLLNAALQGFEMQGCHLSAGVPMAITCVSINSFTLSSDQIPFLLSQATPHSVRLAGPQGKTPGSRAGPGTVRRSFCLRCLLDGRAERRHGKEQIRIAGPSGGSGPPVPFSIEHAHPSHAGSSARGGSRQRDGAMAEGTGLTGQCGMTFRVPVFSAVRTVKAARFLFGAKPADWACRERGWRTCAPGLSGGPRGCRFSNRAQ